MTKKKDFETVVCESVFSGKGTKEHEEREKNQSDILIQGPIGITKFHLNLWRRKWIIEQCA